MDRMRRLASSMTIHAMLPVLERAGERRTADASVRSALGRARVLRSYGEVRGPRRAACRRAAGACGSSPATASPSPRRTARTISKRCTRSGTPGSPRCRPTPSCTARSLATSSNIPARGSASRRADSTARSRRMRRSSLERLIVDRRRRIRKAARRRSDRGRAARAPTISPGCSTPRAPPAGRRARCSPTRCWRPRAMPT